MAVLRGVIDRHEVVTENAPRDRQRSLAYQACRDRAGKAVMSGSKRSMN
jgi:hypothetical protein